MSVVILCLCPVRLIGSVIADHAWYGWKLSGVLLQSEVLSLGVGDERLRLQRLVALTARYVPTVLFA